MIRPSYLNHPMPSAAIEHPMAVMMPSYGHGNASMGRAVSLTGRGQPLGYVPHGSQMAIMMPTGYGHAATSLSARTMHIPIVRPPATMGMHKF